MPRVVGRVATVAVPLRDVERRRVTEVMGAVALAHDVDLRCMIRFEFEVTDRSGEYARHFQTVAAAVLRDLTDALFVA